MGAKIPPKPVTEGPAGVSLWLINDNKHHPASPWLASLSSAQRGYSLPYRKIPLQWLAPDRDWKQVSPVGTSGFVSPPSSHFFSLSLSVANFPHLGSLRPALPPFLGPKRAGVPGVLPPGCLASFPPEYLQSRWGLLVVQEAASPLRCVGGGGRPCPGGTRVPAATGERQWDGGVLKK